METFYKKDEDMKRILQFADKFIIKNEALVEVLKRKTI